jgi:lambda family phage portal protein
MAIPFVSKAFRAMEGAWDGASRAIRQNANGVVPSTISASTTMPGYEGASQSPRMNPFRPNRMHINSILASEAPILRARTRQLIANTAHGANASETFVSYATGTGIVPTPLIENVNQKKQVKQAFIDWTDEADADNLTDFFGLQSMIARALFDAGEVFVRRRDRFASDGLFIPMQLQLLEAEQLDISYNSQAPITGNPIRCSIEFDKNVRSRRLAYWFFREHPGDGTVQFQRNYERVRVPADQILHIYKPLRPGQIRGRPWLTPGIVKLYDWDKYSDAELTRKLGAANYMGAITQDLGGNIADTGLVDEDDEADDSGTVDIDWVPGILPVLPKGHDIKWNDPADVGPNYEAFAYRTLLELCAAMGLPYFSVSGDTSKANYSSIRSALLDFKRRMEQFQWETLIFQFCRPVYVKWWLPAAFLAGAVRLPGYPANPRAYSRVKWIPPKWDWVDPYKDAQAEKLMVDSGFKARDTVIEERGDDPEEVDETIARGKDRATRHGLEFATGTIAHTTPQSEPEGNNEEKPGESKPNAANAA